MNQEIWQKLLALESRDITQQRFRKIHSRDLHGRRAREINAAARQAREYFRNANSSDYSVRPLLTFYGVTSISRALLLLLKAEGGEEGLAAGHGIKPIHWRRVMSGNPAIGLTKLRELRVSPCAGLFSDFVRHTNNRMAIHIHSAGVNWRLSYDIPTLHHEISIADLFSRIPDLSQEYSEISHEVRHASVNEVTYSEEKGFRMKVYAEQFLHFSKIYENLGYTITKEGEWCTVQCEKETLEQQCPLFMHSYIHKIFGAIPSLHAVEPFSTGVRYSQLCITYMISYVLGMLVRYYPTHWVSLLGGEKGDSMWPTIHRAQQIVEESYPELVAEMVQDATEYGHP